MRRRRVKADWLVPLPDVATTRTAMAVGMAGFTEMLARVLDQMKYGASVAAVAFAGGVVLPALVVAFPLRGVTVLSIDNVLQPLGSRHAVWASPVTDMPIDRPEAMITVATLDDLLCLGQEFLAGRITGRTLIGLNA